MEGTSPPLPIARHARGKAGSHQWCVQSPGASKKIARVDTSAPSQKYHAVWASTVVGGTGAVFGRDRGRRRRASRRFGRKVKGVVEMRYSGAEVTTLPKIDTKEGGVLPGDQEHKQELDIVQFTSAIYYVEEGEGHLTVDVMRLGKMRDSLSVKYETSSASAKAGINFQLMSGRLEFNEGEVVKAFKVPIVDEPGWDGTLEFTMHLSSPEGCQLGRYLHKARVKILDESFFPSNMHRELIQKGRIEQIPVAELLWEYFKTNVQANKIQNETMLCLALEQAPNLYFLLTTYLLQYVVDDILPTAVAARPELQAELAAITALYSLPSVALLLVDKWKIDLDLAGRSRAFLQESLFRKYLDWDQDTRAKSSSSDVVLAFSNDVDEVVNAGFMRCFKLAKNFGKIACVAYFLLAENPTTMIPLAAYTVIVPGSLFLFSGKSVQLQERAREKVSDLLDVVQETTDRYRLIADYFMRPFMQDRLAKRVVALSDARRPALADASFKEDAMVVISSLLLGAYVAYGSQEVMNHSLQIGTFIATCTVFKEVGENFESAYENLVEMTTAVGPLQRITQFLNNPSTTQATSQVEHFRRTYTNQLRSSEQLAELRGSTGKRFGSDCLRIELMNLAFIYPDGKRILTCTNMDFEQGKLIAVIGLPHSGKKAFMNLIGQVLFPIQGHIFIPSHLRVLNVDETPLMLEAGLWKNLSMDHDLANVDATRRIWRICERLNFSAYLLRIMAEELASEKGVDYQPTSWKDRLSSTDAAHVNLARALILNPEVLVLHKPVSKISREDAAIVRRLLREHVDNRGLELDPLTASERRPRTVFISGCTRQGVKLSDLVVQVHDKDASIIDKSEVTDDMLL